MAANKLTKYIRFTWLLVWLPFTLIFLLISFISLEIFVDLPSVQELQNPKSNLATVIYSSDMKTLGKYYAENRVSVKYYELDKDLVNALIATEDARFLEHSGVDLRALVRAVFGALTGSSSSGGGSTLSQQLAKMMFPREKLSKFETVIRKLKEWVIAARLEKNYTKDEILALYLNKFDFLNQAVGVKSAAQIYFNRTQDSLEIQQAAMLIGMAKNPSLFNPVKKADTTLHRRNVVMMQMVVNGFLTKEKYDSLKVLPLGVIFHPEDHNDGLAPYFREYLREYFLKTWCAKHINPETNKPYNIYRDGLKVYTTIDSRMQKYLNVTTPLTISTEPPTPTIHPANLIADNVSRNVVKKSMDKIIRKEKAVKKLQDTIRRKLPLMRPSQEMQNNMLLMRRRLPQIQDDVNNNSATYIQKVVRGHISRRDSRNKILQQASNENARSKPK